MNAIAFGLNFFGLLLQIQGIIAGGFAVKPLVFPKGSFTLKSVSKKSFTVGTPDENLPMDPQTNQPVREIAKIKMKTAIFGVISLVVGLGFQIVALWFD